MKMISHVSSATSGDAAYKAYIAFDAPEQTRLGMTVVVTAGKSAADNAE